MDKFYKLTKKQQTFVKKFAECWNATEAYKFAYDTNTTAGTVRKNACVELNKPHVQEGLAAFLMKAEKAQKGEITPDVILERLMAEATQADSDGARVSALNVLSKCFAMQTTKTIDETARDMPVEEMLLAFCSGDYMEPVRDYSELEESDKVLYDTLIRKVTGFDRTELN